MILRSVMPGHGKGLEFFNVENVTRDDLLAADRIPPQLKGIAATSTQRIRRPRCSA